MTLAFPLFLLSALFLCFRVSCSGVVRGRMRQSLRAGGHLAGGVAHRGVEEFVDNSVAADLIQRRVGHHHDVVSLGDGGSVRGMDATIGEGVEHGGVIEQPVPQCVLAGGGSVGDPYRSGVPAGDGRVPEFHRQATAVDLGEQRQSLCCEGVFE